VCKSMPTYSNPFYSFRDNLAEPAKAKLRSLAQPQDENVWKARILGGLSGAGEGLVDLLTPGSEDVMPDLTAGLAPTATVAAKQAAPAAYEAVKGLKGLYSRLTDAIVGQMPAKASPSKIASIAKSGASAEEAKIRGLDALLKGRDPNIPMSKEEVLSHLEANPLRMAERTLVPESIEPIIRSKWSSYAPGPVVGGVNYKEKLLRDPKGVELGRLEGLQSAFDSADASSNSLIEEIKALKDQVYSAPHWKGFPGVFVHSRSKNLPLMPTRVDVGPVKADPALEGLLSTEDLPPYGLKPGPTARAVFEIQSDQHQQAQRNYERWLQNELKESAFAAAKNEGSYDLLSGKVDDLKFNELVKKVKGDVQAYGTPEEHLLFESKGYRTPEIMARNQELKDQLERLQLSSNEFVHLDEPPYQNQFQGLMSRRLRLDPGVVFTKPAPFSDNASYDLAIKQQLLDAADDPDVKFFGITGPETAQKMFPDEANEAGMEHFYGKEYQDRLSKIMAPFGVQPETRALNYFGGSAGPGKPIGTPGINYDPQKGTFYLGHIGGKHPNLNAERDAVDVASIWPRPSYLNEKPQNAASFAEGNMALQNKIGGVLSQLRSQFNPRQGGFKPIGQEIFGFDFPPELKELVKKIGFPALMALLGLRGTEQGPSQSGPLQ
jgi:hypothetical protein